MACSLQYKAPRTRKRWCYFNALGVLQANQEQPWWLVHGVVNPPAGEAAEKDTGHAWAEIEHEGETWVYDPSLRVEIRAADYYAQLRVGTVVRYTLDEAEAHLKTEGNFGPWADEVSNAHFAKYVGSRHQVVSVLGAKAYSEIQEGT